MTKSKIPAVQKMIARVMKRRECNEADAIDYMLAVATGRLNALWRYSDTVPEGKSSKGILVAKGNKKRAERVAPVKIPAVKVEKAAS